MRLFVALELPAPARAALAAWRDALGPGLGRDLGAGRVRPVADPDLHLTLCFLGEVGDDAAGPIGVAVAGAVGGLAPVRLAWGDALWLPRRRPRVLAAGVQTSDTLADLHGRVASALVAGGWYEVETRPFRPHVTVARVRGQARGPGAPADRPARGRPASGNRPPRELGGCPSAPFTAGTVAVIRSHLGSGPACYERLRTVTLGTASAREPRAGCRDGGQSE